MILVLIVSILWFSFAFGHEAVIVADDVTTQTIKNGKTTDVFVTMSGDVEIKGEDFKIETQRATMLKSTKDIEIPVDSKTEYTGANEKITVYAKKVHSNPTNKTFKGQDVKFISNIASYKSKKVDVKNGNATFKNVKFSTCKIFDSNAKECRSPWFGKAKKVDYNYNEKNLKAKHFVMHLHGIPIFYTPYLKINLEKNKDGFQKFKLVNTNQQRGISFNYIKRTQKYGAFVITPELYISQGNKSNLNSRSNNIQFVHEYERRNGFKFNTDIKIAPNSGLFDDQGNSTNKTGTRYYILTNNEYGKNNYSFSSGIEQTSDRFFQRFYNSASSLANTNYFISRFDYFNFNQKNQTYGIATKHYTTLTEFNQNTIPSLVSSVNYNKQFDFKKGIKITSSNEILNFQRNTGTSGTRLGTTLSANKIYKYNTFNIETNGNLRLQNYSYRNPVNFDHSNAQRIFGSGQITASKLYLYSYKNYVTQIKPIVFTDYTTSKETNSIVNEDSSTTFVTDSSVFLSSKFSGYDIVDEGLKVAYGVDVKTRDIKNNANVNLFVAQRYNNFDGFSDYVGRASMIWQRYRFDSRFILQKNGLGIKYSNTNLFLPLAKFIDIGLGYYFIDKGFSVTTADIVNYRYSIKLKHNSHFVFADILQNPKFVDANGSTRNVISRLSSGIGYESNCLFYRFGIQRQMIVTGLATATNNVYIVELRLNM